MNKKVLFCGLSVSAQSWYRCGLPATYLQQDWLGIVNGPPNEGIAVGGRMLTNTMLLFFKLLEAKTGKSLLSSSKKREQNFFMRLTIFSTELGA
jgi:hypothetical protein